MNAKNIIKFAGLAATILLFISLLFVGFFFEATHITVNDTLETSAFSILNVNTIVITTLCTAYALLLLPWILYFMRFDKKSGLQYLSIYQMTGKRAGKVAAVALTILNLLTGIAFYIVYVIYVSSTSREISEECHLSIVTMLCCAIVFWGGTYLIYGSLYGVRRFKEIIRKKRERRKARKQQQFGK